MKKSVVKQEHKPQEVMNDPKVHGFGNKIKTLFFKPRIFLNSIEKEKR